MNQRKNGSVHSCFMISKHVSEQLVRGSSKNFASSVKNSESRFLYTEAETIVPGTSGKFCYYVSQVMATWKKDDSIGHMNAKECFLVWDNT